MQFVRVILFTAQMDAMSRFYGQVLGLKQVTDEKGWKEFDAGGIRIALHSGPASPAEGPEAGVLRRRRCGATVNACRTGSEVRESTGGRQL